MLKYLAKTFSIAVTVAFAILAATWPMRADLIDGAMVAARSILPPNVISQGSYTATLQDCFRPAVILSTNTLVTFTLPASSSLPFGCRIKVVNGDTYSGDNTGRGKKLSGLPSDWYPILWPRQAGEVVATGATWTTTVNPGRWKVPQTVTIHVNTSGNNSNDGLASGSTNAIADAQQAWNNNQYQYDTQGSTTIIAMACSQTHTVALNMGGAPVGSNLVQVSPDGNCSFTWTNSGPCISVGDLAELDLRLNQYGGSGSATFGCNISNAALTGNIYIHNQTPVLDLEGTPIWNPAGGNDNFLFCDGPCQYTIANGITQATAAGGNRIIFMSAGGHGTQSGTISASASGSIGGIFFIGGNSMFIRGTSDGGGWATAGASIVTGSSVLINNGVSTAGGVTVGTSAVNCASLTSTC